VKIKIINKNSSDMRVTAVRARHAPKIIKMNIIEKRRKAKRRKAKRRKAKRRKAKRRKARYYCIEMETFMSHSPQISKSVERLLAHVIQTTSNSK
jgi:hypothetical protein